MEGPQPQLPELSASVRDVLSGLDPETPVPAASLVNGIFERHGEYARGLGAKVRLEPGEEARPPAEWLIAAREPFGDALPMLDGRAMIVGLALVDRSVGEQCVGSGLLEPLLPELEAHVRGKLDELMRPGATQALREMLSRGFTSNVGGPSRKTANGPAQKAARKPAQQTTEEPAQKTTEEPAQQTAQEPADDPVRDAPAPDLHTALRALSDAPTTIDHGLRFSDYADALAEFIESPETSKPLTLGIDAAWGMGKTSLMYMIRERLDPEGMGRHRRGKFRRFRTVWFNAWKYDKEEALWAALVLEILAEVRRRSTPAQRLGVWWRLNRERFDLAQAVHDFAAAGFKALVVLALGAVAVAAAVFAAPGDAGWAALAAPFLGAVGLSGVWAAGQTVFKHLAAPFSLNVGRYVRTPRYEEKIGFLSEFEDDFRRVVRAVTQDGKWPLVVFIDDLDRCAPTKAAEVVEAISTVLDTEHSIFILGMDGDAVAASIGAKYEALEKRLPSEPGGLTLGERFLEKIVQISFRIPRAEPNLVEAFVGSVLQIGGGTAAPKEEPGVREAEHMIRAQQRAGQKGLDDATAEAGKEARGTLSDEDLAAARERLEAQAAAEAENVRVAVVEAARYLEFNPRKIKRFVNTFRLQALIARRRGLLTGDADVKILARSVIIGTRWPDFVDDQQKVTGVGDLDQLLADLGDDGRGALPSYLALARATGPVTHPPKGMPVAKA